MNRKIKAILTITIGTSMLTFGGSDASMQTNRQADGTTTRNSNTSADMIGNLSTDEFERVNAEGQRAVAAIAPTSGALSKADQKLMTEVAMGGMMQLEVSRAALEKVTSPEARLLAQSEVEEQTGVAAKLREIAAAKGFTLPAAPDPKTAALISKMNGVSGNELDVFYIRESGVNGHEKLQKVMTKVQSKATDPSMKSLAAATLPVIRVHMQVSRAEVAKKSGGNNRNNSARK
ncbi:MAG TPA: DUF4142 domain-containing protein [Pyrinomonadaceae bacterium]|jgi:putative membrane protein